MPSVLVVDDLVSIHEMLEAVIAPNGFSTAFATDGERALVKYREKSFDLVLADIDMKPMDGLMLLKNLKLVDPAAVVILITAYASTDSAIQALKQGAFDYIAKPFKVDELIRALRRGLEFREAQLLKQKEEAQSGGVMKDEQTPAIVGESAKMKRVLQQAARVINSRAPILILGETGSGKSTLATYIHTSWARSKPFVAVDCVGRSADELRAELFGTTGKGGTSVEQAREGMLYLKNVQSLPAEQQKALTRMLQTTDVPFRLVCDSTEDVEKLVDEGKFSDELFYRIASLPLSIPPMRDRPEDIPLLVKHFAEQAHNAVFDVHQVEFTEDAMRLLCSYNWPGNLLELKQVITRVVSEAEQRIITADELPMRLNQLSDWPKLEAFLAGQRMQYVQTVLNACRGDRVRAASVLGIPVAEVE